MNIRLWMRALAHGARPTTNEWKARRHGRSLGPAGESAGRFGMTISSGMVPFTFVSALALITVLRSGQSGCAGDPSAPLVKARGARDDAGWICRRRSGAARVFGEFQPFGVARRIFFAKRLLRNSCRPLKRTQSLHCSLPGTAVPGFHVPPLRGWHRVYPPAAGTRFTWPIATSAQFRNGL